MHFLWQFSSFFQKIVPFFIFPDHFMYLAMGFNPQKSIRWTTFWAHSSHIFCFDLQDQVRSLRSNCWFFLEMAIRLTTKVLENIYRCPWLRQHFHVNVPSFIWKIFELATGFEQIPFLYFHTLKCRAILKINLPKCLDGCFPQKRNQPSVTQPLSGVLWEHQVRKCA